MNMPQIGDNLILHIGDMDFPCTCTEIGEDGFRTIVTSTPCRDFFHAGDMGYGDEGESFYEEGGETLGIMDESSCNSIFLSFGYGETFSYPARHATDVNAWMEKV